MRAMAMRILVRRKMIVRRMIASATDMIITEGEGEEKYEKMKPLHTIISHTHINLDHDTMHSTHKQTHTTPYSTLSL